MGFIAALDWLNGIVIWLFPPVCAWILLSGSDDFFISMAWLALGVRNRLRAGRPEPPVPTKQQAIAILVPLWREHRVIRQMVETNTRAIRYSNYHFFIGVYPNDEPTLEVVRGLAAEFPHVHLAVAARPGPTSKADCLNSIYQYLVNFEALHRGRFEIVVIHDAEDVIHPDALDRINRYSSDYAMIQVPVLPLPTRILKVTHGVYCDEFAEYQSKDIPVRQWLGGFLPSNGVGTGFARGALERLASGGEEVFNPAALTEDYEIGLKLHSLGFRQKFLTLDYKLARPVATREFFPDTLLRAVRQRIRWVTGICLQGWEHHGWRGGVGQWYWYWRDRKGVVGNLAGVAANLLAAYCIATLLFCRAAGVPWTLGSRIERLPLSGAAGIMIGLQVAAVLCRAIPVARFYGWRFAAFSPLRAIYANVLNCTATVMALRDYICAWRSGRRMSWRKTEHAYPIKGTGRESGWLHPFEVDPGAAYALPAHIIRRWRVLPFRVAAGSLFLASPGCPDETMRSEVRRFTNLEIQVRLVSAENFEQLAAGLYCSVGGSNRLDGRKSTKRQWRPRFTRVKVTVRLRCSVWPGRYSRPAV